MAPRYMLRNLPISDPNVPDKGNVRLILVEPKDRPAKYTRIHKPSALLLHYHYGAMAVKKWGHESNILSDVTYRPNIPRPPKRPLFTMHVRHVAIDKYADTHGAGDAAVDEVGGKSFEDMDEDERMLFFWSNTRAARERREAAAEDFSVRMRHWAETVETR
ncbi:hypothetical protein A0H81_14071 [Grifola frondosa]|uniref:Uncharacterized protein n=1 Tax=Grifola frondosa TaxID=5627 RepID=A0A1C7LMP3_GRIFR|nr:hypothetical protein A0H81_14071 [Grifola frondosa]